MPEHTFRSEAADLQWSANGLPFSARFQDVFYSQEDPLGESTHVFLQASNLAERFSLAVELQQTFVIAELGFGAGLNFMFSWKLWQEITRSHKSEKQPGKKLHYIAYERYPLTNAELSRLHQRWTSLSEQAQKLQAVYQCDCTGWHRCYLSEDVTLDLFIGDAVEALELRHPQDLSIDAWFLDGFAPDRNPEMWSAKLFKLMALHSHEKTSAVTYSSAGNVRRAMMAAGFSVEKAPGFASKRHMLVASGCDLLSAAADAGSVTTSKPWFVLPAAPQGERKAIIIGAGLAGCHVAHALARRKWQVHVLDIKPDLEQGITNIPQLALRCRLFNELSLSARFYLQAYVYAASFFASLHKQGNCGWFNSGLLQLVDALNKRKPTNTDVIAELYPDAIAQVGGSPRNLGKVIDESVIASGIWFASGGWIDPLKLCQRLLGPREISVKWNCAVTQVIREQGLWKVCQDDQVVESAEVVIVANGAGLASLNQTSTLPLEMTSGQCTLIDSRPSLTELNAVVCGRRTIFPQTQGIHTIAASYNQPGQAEPRMKQNDLDNLSAAAELFDDSITDQDLTGSIEALRVNTRDRLPLVGPLAQLGTMAKQYEGLSKNARRQFSEPGCYHSGLYISAGHGSNGLSTCPLSGEYLASLINGDCLPIDRQTIDALNPCRFLIQDLKKQRSA